MCRRKLKEVCYILRPEHPTTQVQRYGGTTHTITKVTSGAWDVLSMKWRPWSHHSEQIIWRVFSRKCKLASFQSCPIIFHLNLEALSKLVCKLSLICDQTVIRSWTCQWSTSEWLSSSQSQHRVMTTCFSKRLKCLATWCMSQSISQGHPMLGRTQSECQRASNIKGWQLSLKTLRKTETCTSKFVLRKDRKNNQLISQPKKKANK